MRKFLLVLILLTAVAGCSRKEESGSFAEVRSSEPASANAKRYLAYQHAIHVDTEEHKIAAVYEAAQAACREAASDLCTVLESRISTGRSASASLKFRAKPDGIRKLIAVLGKQAEVIDQSTTAEDLASPIEDTAKKLKMLNDYRAKLESMLGRANNDVDALIKINRELAQVQSEIEAETGTHAHLMQRVETEILDVSIGSVQNRSFWRPIALSAADFGTNLSSGVSIAITGTAYLIPWVFLLGLVAWGGRRLWRRRSTKNENSGREA